jgi:hypothetical protein
VQFARSKLKYALNQQIVETSAQPTSPPAFHSDDVEHVANYQSLSVAALISLLIGLASPLAILSKVFLFVPLCGLALSLLALRRISLSEGRLAGRWAALVGLVLCAVSAATAITRDSVAHHMRANQAQQFATHWLSILAANDTDQAFKMTYQGARPLPPSEPGAPPVEQSPYEKFLSDPLIKKITAAGKQAKIEFVKTLEFSARTRREAIVRQLFRIVPAGGSPKDAIDAYITVQRSHFRGERDIGWLVVRYEPTDVPTSN